MCRPTVDLEDIPGFARARRWTGAREYRDVPIHKLRVYRDQLDSLPDDAVSI